MCCSSILSLAQFFFLFSFVFVFIIVYLHKKEQSKIKIEPRIKLNYNIIMYFILSSMTFLHMPSGCKPETKKSIFIMIRVFVK